MEQVQNPRASDIEATAQPTSTAYLTAAQTQTLRRAREGDQRALRSIYETHQAQVRGHLYRLLGADADVDDLVQSVFARAFQSLDGFKGNSAISTWLYRITANTTHNLLRQRYRRNRVKRAFHWFALSRGTDLSSGKVEARDEAMRLLAQLPPELREIFVLYHYQGLTLVEIAQIVERPISTVGDRLSRARKQLRQLV